MEKRKNMRLQDGNYNIEGVFFLTICTKDRKCILSNVVGDENYENAKIQLTKYGQIAEKYLKQINDFYDYISIENYVIMPNHIHILLYVKDNEKDINANIQNSLVSKFISTFKRFCNKECGENIWQYRSYDHIIRDERDYYEHMAYIHENPMRWQFDKLYTK